jgi:TP901-1 family phage major tail protein
LIAGAGVKSAEISGAGVFKDAASDAAVRESFFLQSARTWRVIIPDFGVMQGPFLIEKLDYGGVHDGEATFAVTLVSAAALGFTPL